MKTRSLHSTGLQENLSLNILHRELLYKTLRQIFLETSYLQMKKFWRSMRILLQQTKKPIGSDLSVYDTYLASYQESYYIPEGVRYVRHILIALDDELASEINTTRSNDGDEAANTLRDESLLTIEEKANEVLSLLQNEEITFTDAIAEYNDDPGMEYYPEGYEIYSGCTLYVPEFTDNAMSLENVGDITGLVATDYGYHIIEYTTDRASGPVSLRVCPAGYIRQSAPDSSGRSVAGSARPVGGRSRLYCV